MYRIELAPGEEALFKSIDEMAAGIANGVIKRQARIWHQTSAKWLPIEFHPHYKIALTKGPKETPKSDYHESPAVAGPAFDRPAARPLFEAPAPKPIFEAPPRAIFETAPAKPLFAPPAPKPAAERPAPVSPYAPPPSKISDPPSHAPMAIESQFASAIDAVMSGPRIDVAAVADSVAPLGEIETIDLPGHHAPIRRGRTWTVGLIAAGVIIVLGGGAALSAFRSSHRPPATKPTPAKPVSYGAQPAFTPSTPSFGARNTRPADDTATVVKPAEPAPARIADAPRISDAPRIAIGAIGLSDSDRPASDRPSVVTPATLVAHYAAAYDAARADLDRGMRMAGINTIFSASRINAGGVATARSSVAGAANLVRVYRKRSATIEQIYRDSVNLLTRQIGWTPAQISIWENRPTQLESPESATLANSLLDTMDGTLEVLSAHEGGYELSGGAVTFRDSQPARDYGSARRRLSALFDGGADSGTPAGRIIRVMNGASAPEEHVGN